MCGIVGIVHRDSTHSVAPAVIRQMCDAIRHRGPDDEGVTRLRGMFAFAIWDAKARTLLLARDRFGIKPLYIATGPWGIAFASELKALHAAGLADRTLDWDALDMYFQVGYIPAPATPFAGVTKLEPGHTALWHRQRGVSTTRH